MIPNGKNINMSAEDSNFNKIENNLFFKVLSKNISSDDLMMLKIKVCWLKYPGKPFSDFTFPYRLDSQNGLLEIVCYPQGYAQEIIYFKKEILDNLNKHFKDLNLKDLRVSVDRLKTERLKEQSPAQSSEIMVSAVGASEMKPSEGGDGIKKGIVKLKEISRRICEWEFSHGAGKCRKCSLPAKRGSDMCSLCRWEENEAVENTVISYLNEKLFEFRPDCKETVRERINAELTAKGLPEIDLEHYNRLKNRIHSQNKNDIWRYINSLPEGSRIDDWLSAELVELACLISEKSPSELDDNIMLKALGPSLTAIYNSKTVNRSIWSYIYSLPEGSRIDGRLSARLLEMAGRISGKSPSEIDEGIMLKALGPSLTAIYSSKTVSHSRKMKNRSRSTPRQAPPN